MRRLSVTFVICTFALSSAVAQIGVFDESVLIGDVPIEGSASFADGTYSVESVGTGIGRSSPQDSFQFVYKEISGNFSITGTPFPLSTVGEAGLMIRQDLDPDSVHVSLLMTSSGLGASSGAASGSVFPHYRTIKGGATIYDGDPSETPGDPGGLIRATGPMRLERIGNSVHIYTYGVDVTDPDSGPDDDWVLLQSEEALLGDTLWVGLAATANTDSDFGEFEISDVEIEEYPLSVMRSIPTDTIEPGSTISGISITAQTREGQTVDASVTEIAPIDGIVSNVQVTGGEVVMNPDQSVSWNLNGFTGEATLTYDLTLGPRPSAVWKGTFNDGIHLESYIGGDQLLPKNPTFTPYETPVELDPEKPVVIQAEQATITPEDGSAHGLLFTPQGDSGISVVMVAGTSGNLMEMPIVIPEDYGDIYLFGQVRGEDGNSDSFFVNIEFFPTGDNTNEVWEIIDGNADFPQGQFPKYFRRDWVKNRVEGEDPRPFADRTPGESWIYITFRESNAMMDWLAVTNDPALDIDHFVEVEPAAPVAVQDFMLY